MSFDVRTEYQDPQTALAYDTKRFSSLSGRIFQWAERRALRRIIRMLPPGVPILDAPTGTGRILPLFVRQGLAPFAADISGQMLGVARHRTAEWNGRVRFSRMDFLNIPLADDAVAAVFSIRFLPHIPPAERVAMLREFRRVSRRWVVISLSLSSPWHRLRRRIKGWLGHWKPVRHPASSASIREELRQAGLREVKRVRTFPVLSEQILLVCEKV